LLVEIPANTSAEVWVPRLFERQIRTPERTTFLRSEAGHDVYRVGSGVYRWINGGAPRSD
jgi:hypothetical protein